MNLNRINEIIDRYGADRTASLAVLQDIQREYNYLPREALELTAQRLGISNGEIFRLATFFTAFSLQPKGENVCKVCMGTACHVRCLGACALGPVVVVNEEPHGHLTPDKAVRLIARLSAEKEQSEAAFADLSSVPPAG